MTTFSADETIQTITSLDPEVRHRSLQQLLGAKDHRQLLDTAQALDRFRRTTDNLYQRVRASLFLYALHRFHLIGGGELEPTGLIPVAGIQAARERRFEAAIDIYLDQPGPLNEALCSALADAYHKLAFDVLARQVHLSIEASPGNEHLFGARDVASYAFRAPATLTRADPKTGLFPMVRDATGVRMDPSHSGWSDIFFLGMDYPEGARVTNISINLGIRGEPGATRAPVVSFCRMIRRPVIRVTSVDLAESREIADLEQLFNVASDHLGLLKAGIIASGLVPPALRGSDEALSDLLRRLLGRPGGFELVTHVRRIPKGSRLAVSTSLLACIITSCMRFSGQIPNLSGTINEQERRLVASRAILGEWLGGSGGGWQDSGGIWPGVKIITGQLARPGDPEFGVSRGTLLPTHTVLSDDQCHPELEQRLTSSLILIHGGMAQNVGPVLEMVTEKYLLRLDEEWAARLRGQAIFDEVVAALKQGDIRRLGELTSRNFDRCLTPIIPWVTNAYTDAIRHRLSQRFGEAFWGFLMLGGMTGGGMAYIVDPRRRSEIIEYLQGFIVDLKREMEQALPFAMDPVVYDFAVNHRGIEATVLRGQRALMPDGYYRLRMLEAVTGSTGPTPTFCREVEHFARHSGPEVQPTVDPPARFKALYRELFELDIDTMIASLSGQNPAWEAEAERIRRDNGFDEQAHARLKEAVRSGTIGVAKNRLPLTTVIEDAGPDDLVPLGAGSPEDLATGEAALDRSEVAVLTLAGGLGSRWTDGAGVVKAINPFVAIAGRHRSFVEIHLAKSRATARGRRPHQHAFSTSFLTHVALSRRLSLAENFGYRGPVYLSHASAIGQKLVPTEADLRFVWEELSRQLLSAHVQRVQDDLHQTLIAWARQMGEAEDYRANEPAQRFYPPGHWYEVPNLFKNGTLARMLRDNPSLKHLLVHNADTLGAWLDPEIIGGHLRSGSTISFEVTPRRHEDVGGGLARVDGRLQLVEGMALPREDDEFRLRYYNTLTSLVSLDPLLDFFGLCRDDILAATDSDERRQKVHDRIAEVEARLPTYATIKDVKLRWGAGHEDVFPVLQCEKLWGDMSRLDGLSCRYLAVPRFRGQQLKDPNLLDPWVKDGSKQHIADLADFEH